MTIELNIFEGPAVQQGFRTGFWKYKIDGKENMVHLSLPAEMPLEEQKQALTEAVLRQQKALAAASKPVSHHHGQCPKCGGTMLGDGYTMPEHCEYTEPPDGAEADSGPWYCDFEEAAT